MKKILFISLVLLIGSFAHSSESTYADNYEDLFVHKREGLLIEAYPIGLISGVYFPSRIASFSYLFLSGFSIQLAPIVGYGEMKGFGSSFAFHFGKDRYENGFRYGPRFALVNVKAVDFDEASEYGEASNVGNVYEIYFDFLSYYAISGSWRWHWGISIGNGISDYGNRNDIGPYVSTGGTYRAEIGFGRVIN